MFFAIIFLAISFWKIAIMTIFLDVHLISFFFFIAKLLGKVTLKENDRGAWCMQQQEQQQARRIDLLSHYSLWENCRRDDSEIIGKKLHISPIHHDLEFYQKIRSGMPFFLGTFNRRIEKKLCRQNVVNTKRIKMGKIEQIFEYFNSTFLLHHPFVNIFCSYFRIWHLLLF